MQFSILIALLIILPISANAEVHKYKDANGKWVYSDFAPPASVKQEVFGRKTVQPTGVAPLSPVVSPVVTPVTDKSQSGLTKEQAAAKRQEAAEKEKRNHEEKDAQNKQKEANCKSAKENLAAYTQGGRIYKINENGGRDYMDDKALEAGKIQAQQDIQSNCS